MSRAAASSAGVCGYGLDYLLASRCPYGALHNLNKNLSSPSTLHVSTRRSLDSIGVSANDHARSSKRTGKERTAADHRKAFSARRADAASWFRAFREDLARASMLRPKAESSTSSSDPGSPAAAQARDGSVARKVLAILRDAGGENRSSGAGPGRGGGKGGGRLNSTVLGGGAGGGSMLGRGGNTRYNA